MRNALTTAMLATLAAANSAAAMEIRINGMSLEDIENSGLARVEKAEVAGGQTWTVDKGTSRVLVVRGKGAIAERVKALKAELQSHVKTGNTQTAEALEGLEAIEPRTNQSIQGEIDCSGTLDFAPSFSRNMWYGHVTSTLTWTMWPGPAAPWNNWIWAYAAALSPTYNHHSGWYVAGPFRTTQGYQVSASAGVGPTAGIDLYAYGYYESDGACASLWFQEVNTL